MADIVLAVTLNRESGQVNVSGPLADKVLCLGLLEMAKNLVHNYTAPVGPKILVPGNGTAPLLPPGGA